LIRYDSRSLISSKNRSVGESVQMTNGECELYEFSLYSIRELHTNHELRITNREYTRQQDLFVE